MIKILNNKYKFLQINNKIQQYKVESKYNIIQIMINKIINLFQIIIAKKIKKLKNKTISVNLVFKKLSLKLQK